MRATPVICAGGAIVVALAAWIAADLGGRSEDELAGRLRRLVQVGQVLRENDGRWPDDLIAAARRLPEIRPHLDAAEAELGRPLEDAVHYLRPHDGTDGSETVVEVKHRGHVIRVDRQARASIDGIRLR